MTAVFGGTPKDIGGLVIRRALPQAGCRAVGPFVFLDHIGPAELAAGAPGVHVRPHPHIGLATVTYLFEDTFVHRDSTGVVQAIAHGDVNWMIAGRGVVHSERQDPAVTARGQRLHGLQVWYALPAADEERPPSFEHHPRATLPTFRVGDADLVVVVGDLLGRQSPVTAPVRTRYAMATLGEGKQLTVPAEHAERAVYVVRGAINVDGVRAEAGELAVLQPGVTAVVIAAVDATLCLLGGDALDAHRAMEWNFVSSRRERITRAIALWRVRTGASAGAVGDREEAWATFPAVPGDDEFIPY